MELGQVFGRIAERLSLRSILAIGFLNIIVVAALLLNGSPRKVAFLGLISNQTTRSASPTASVTAVQNPTPSASPTNLNPGSTAGIRVTFLTTIDNTADYSVCKSIETVCSLTGQSNTSSITYTNLPNPNPSPAPIVTSSASPSVNPISPLPAPPDSPNPIVTPSASPSGLGIAPPSPSLPVGLEQRPTSKPSKALPSPRGSVRPQPTSRFGQSLRILSAYILDVRSNQATVSWSVNRPVRVSVSYGNDTKYGQTVDAPAYLTAGSVVLHELKSQTGQHVRVIVTDQTGKSLSSADIPFTTLADPAADTTIKPVAPVLTDMYFQGHKIDPRAKETLTRDRLLISVRGHVAGTEKYTVVGVLHSNDIVSESKVTSSGDWTFSFNVAQLGEGDHRIEAYAKNENGTISSIVPLHSFTIKTQPPARSSVGPLAVTIVIALLSGLAWTGIALTWLSLSPIRRYNHRAIKPWYNSTIPS